MIDLINFTSIILLTLSVFQTITGVGILVLGTPIMLLLGLKMVEIMTLLLPLSILNSSINLFYLKYSIKKIQIDYSMKSYFFFICLPGIFLGLIVLKFFASHLNFNYLVSFSIWLFLLFSYFKKKNFQFSKFLKKNFIFVTGVIHGLTNSGGSLLSLLIVNTYKKNLDYLRYQIIFFYFFLAIFQYFSIIFIFEYTFFINLKIDYILSLIIGVLLGNILMKSISLDIIKNLIYALAFLSSIFLVSQA